MFKPRIKKLEGDLEYLGYIRAQLATTVQGWAKLKKEQPDDWLFRLIADSLCDENGKLITTKEEVAAEIDVLTSSELMEVIFEFNKVSKTKEEIKADLKNAPKP